MENWEEISEIDKKQLSAAINKLLNLATVREIAHLARTQLGCTLALCTSSIESESGKIQFVLYRDKQPDLLSVSELSVSIQGIIDYEDILIHPATLFSEDTLNKRFKDLTPVDEKHLPEIQRFFKKNYAQFIQTSPQSPPLFSFTHERFFPQETPSPPQLNVQQLLTQTSDAFTRIYDSVPRELHNSETAAIILKGFIDSALQHTPDNKQLIEELSRFISSHQVIQYK